MNKFILSPLRNRTVGYFLGLTAATVAIISAILLVIVDYGDRTCSMAAFAFMLAGGLSFVITAFTSFKFAPLIQGVCYIFGFANQLLATLPSLSDVWNGVKFIGGNAIVGLIFTICFAFSAILCTVSNFMEQSK